MMTLGDEVALKRLLFEGHTMVLSQLREAVSNPEASHSRRLPQVERSAKLAELKARLVDTTLEKAGTWSIWGRARGVQTGRQSHRDRTLFQTLLP